MLPIRARLVPSVILLAATALATGPEPIPTLRAADLLPPTLLSGPHFKVDDAVKSDGYMTAFVVHSDFGEFPARSREMLELRVREVAAIAQLDDVSKTEVFAKSLGAAAQKKAKALANVATHPAETAKAVPQSMGRFFKGVGAKGKKAAGDAKDAVTDDGQTPSGPDKSTEGQAGDAAKDVSGMSKARRQWAKKLGVDPYTTNAVLAKQLDDIGWAAYAGGFTMNIVTPGVVGMATSVNNMVWELPPEDIAKKNDEKLKAMGVSDADRKAFLKNSWFTPGLQTEFVAALESLGAVKGRDGAVALAAREAQSEDDARFFRRNAAMLARYRAGGGSLSSVDARPRLFVGRTSGMLVFPAAVDYLTWTAEAATVSHEPGLAAAKREIWLSGTASPTAKTELAAAGWTVKEDALRR
jgi:hypothetical protein